MLVSGSAGLTPKEIRECLTEHDPDLIMADGFDEALIGTVDGATRSPVVCYDFDKCVEILVARGMDEEEATEYMEFNVLGAFVGELTPLFVHDLRNV